MQNRRNTSILYEVRGEVYVLCQYWDRDRQFRAVFTSVLVTNVHVEPQPSGLQVQRSLSLSYWVVGVGVPTPFSLFVKKGFTQRNFNNKLPRAREREK